MIELDYSPENAVFMLDSTPTENPPSGWILYYYKTDGQLYTLGSDGEESQISSGSVLIEVTTSSNIITQTKLQTPIYLSLQYTVTGPMSVQLPEITANNHGQIIILKDAGYNANKNNISIIPYDTNTIEKDNNGQITRKGEAWSIIANNTTKNRELH